MTRFSNDLPDFPRPDRLPRLALRAAGLLAACACLAAMSLPAPAGAADGQPPWLADIEELVAIETWRAPDGSNEAQVAANLKTIQAKFAKMIAERGSGLPQPFEWRDDEKPYWVFGWRVGSGARKVALLTHLDTVPPGSAGWRPFEPRIEQRIYKGSVTDFLVGRGAIDDKGPAVVALNALFDVLPDLAQAPGALADVTLEILFDTSEETDMSTPHYYEANPGALPDIGIVFDGFWCIRAEKGVERPVFSVPFTDNPQQGLWVAGFETSPGPANQIADWAEARITGGAAADLDGFAQRVTQWYRGYAFDDPDYQAATLQVTRQGTDVVLRTLVAGAQHGSGPDENRAKGANPLVSLANFIAHLAAADVLGANHHTRMADFIAWGWGTTVFGEKHPDLLYRHDPVFGEGNGTTYALTRLAQDTDRRETRLALDIRYAVGHHAQGFDGSDGMIGGDSLFGPVFATLVQRYAASPGGSAVAVETATAAGPDIRSPGNRYLTAVNDAYREAMGESCPMRAIGGGTDAKGHPQLVAAGALFTGSLGAPVNFHGINEGAPIIDLINSKKVLVSILRRQSGLE